MGIWGIISVFFLILLIYTLFFALPFDETYLKTVRRQRSIATDFTPYVGIRASYGWADSIFFMAHIKNSTRISSRNHFQLL